MEYKLYNILSKKTKRLGVRVSTEQICRIFIIGGGG
jgi:hypothetical protein